MKVYLLTSDKYTPTIVPINIYFLSKYWPTTGVTIVGYKEVLKLKNLPSNVEVVCVGDQEEFGVWSNGLIPFFKNIPEDYFTLIFDDHILMREFDENKLQILEKHFIHKKVDKAMIGGGLSLARTSKLSNDLLLFNQGINYRTSLHPAIWTKNYFLKYLRPNMTSWDFELKNDREAMFDGAKIINLNYNFPEAPDAPNRDAHLYTGLELCTKGKFNIDRDGKVLGNDLVKGFFKKEDIKYICTRIYE